MDENKKDETIDIILLTSKLWRKKKFILKFFFICLVMGLIVSYSMPKEYTTTLILTSKSGKSASGSMGALASMAGLNLGDLSGDDAFSPELYPDVLKSTPFIQSLYNIRVVDPNQKIDTTLYKYIESYQKKPWWKYLFGIPSYITNNLFNISNEKEIKNVNDRYISENEMNIIETISGTYGIMTEKKTNITTISTTAQSSAISALLADTITSYLQKYIIEQRTKKAKTDLENTKKLYYKAKSDYYKAQQNLAAFVDANKNVVLATYKVNQEKLQNEVSLQYSVYNQMAQQVQLNEIKVQNDIPVFTIIQPAVEPLYASSPKKKIITFIFSFLGLIGVCTWILRKDFITMFKDTMTSK